MIQVYPPDLSSYQSCLDTIKHKLADHISGIDTPPKNEYSCFTIGLKYKWSYHDLWDVNFFFQIVVTAARQITVHLLRKPEN